MDGLRFNQESGTKVIVMHLFVLFIVPLPFSFMFEIWCQKYSPAEPKFRCLYARDKELTYNVFALSNSTVD